jgi:uncharacterized membrane protein (Fun14 family)
MRLLLAIARRQSTNQKIKSPSTFFVTTSAALFTSTTMKNNMSHAEQLPQSRSSSSSSSLTSAALELSGNALSILGNTLNELGDAAKQSAGTNTSTSGLNRVVNEHSSQSSQSSPPFPSLPSSALPRDLGLQLSIGGICGFCSGYALKKVGKTAAFVFGIGFLSLQAVRFAQTQQLLQQTPSSQQTSSNTIATPAPLVDWAMAEAEMIKLLDADKDGKISLNDIHTLSSKLVSSLSLGLPSSGAFAAAFFLGIRWG